MGTRKSPPQTAPSPTRGEVSGVCRPASASDMEDLGVARLDLIALGFDRDRIVFHHLDVAQRLAAGLVLDRGMRRAQPAYVRDQLLRFQGEHVALEQARRI